LELIDEYQDDNEGEGMSAAENYDYYSLVNKKFTFVEEAACRGAGPELFFLEEGQGTENHHKLEQARTICSTCQVKKDCLDFALDNNIGSGIWAGTTPLQRKALRRERRNTNRV
jgi:WhiB family transcriptional regulator, redox-sensing transcriptional regulator